MNSILKYHYSKKSFFLDSFPFAIRKLSNRAEDFNLNKRFQRQFWKIAYIIQGSGNYVIGEQKIPFREKSIIVTHPDAETTWDINGEELQLFNLVFDRSFLQPEIIDSSDCYHFLRIFSTEYSTEYESPLFLLTADREIDSLIRSLYSEYEERRQNREQLIRLRFQELLLLILRRVESGNRRNPAWTARYVSSYLQYHFTEKITPKKLAEIVELSPERLCRLFREQTGCSIMEKLLEIRIAEAKRLLETTFLSCNGITRKTGFCSLSYFYRCFSRIAGCSPEKWRNLRKSNAQN